MTERPILFNPKMAEAVYNKRKPVTRRIVKPQPKNLDAAWPDNESHTTFYDYLYAQQRGVEPDCSPYGIKGDVLWGKEAWRPLGWSDDFSEVAIQYRDQVKLWRPLPNPDVLQDDKWSEWLLKTAEQIAALPGVTFNADTGLYTWESDDVIPWRSSMFMPRWAARIVVPVTSIRLEQIQEITLEEIFSEGIDRDVAQAMATYDKIPLKAAATNLFRTLWDSIQSKKMFMFDSNPWIYRIGFGSIE